MILVEDGGSSGARGTPAAGTAGDLRCSFLSTLSFSAWSEGGAASRGTANRSAVAATLLRPFQRLRMWGRGASCRRLCFCCGSRAAWMLGADDDGDDDGGAVVPVTPSASARGPRRGEDTTHGAAAPGTQVGSLDSGRGHPHRQYAPPRSRSNDMSGRTSSVAPQSPLDPSQPAASPRAGDSPDDSSFADSGSTPPSSVSLSRQPGGHAESEGGHLVMQRGVLVRMAADGTYARVPEAPMYSGLGRPAPARLGDGRTLQLDPAAEALGGGHGPASNSPTHAAAGTGGDGNSPYAVALALSGLEGSRQPLHTLDQLSAALARCAPYLPIRVEVEADLNSSNTAIAAALSAAAATSTAAAAPAAAEAAASADPPALPLCVHVLGPVHACPTYPALRTLEDMLLEDCDGRRLCVNALHCADLDLRRAGEGGADGATSAAAAAMGAATSLTAAAVHKARSNAFLDLLVSPTADPYATTTTAGGGSGGAAAADGEKCAVAAVAQTLAFVKHLVAAHAAQLTTLHFTRCYVVPHDMGRALPLPLAAVRRLSFEHCALTPAHIDALLAVARQQDALTSSRLAETRPAAGAATRHHRAFAALEELQLSGALTPECVSELLDYIEEQQSSYGETGSSRRGLALRRVSVPSAVVRAAREHPFVQASGGRIHVSSL